MIGAMLWAAIAGTSPAESAPPTVEIDAPPRDVAQLEEAVEAATHESKPTTPTATGGPTPKVQIVRQPTHISIIVIDPRTGTATVREVPLDGELTEVASQEVGQIVAEALAAYAAVTAAAPSEPAADVVPAPPPAVEPEPPAPSPPTSPPEQPSPEPGPYARRGFVGLGVGPGLQVVRGDLFTTATLNTALSLGFVTDIDRRRTHRQRSSPHASFAFRFGTDTLFNSAGSVSFYDLWARVRLGSVTGNNFTYASGAMGASIVILREKEIDPARDVRFGGSFGMGSQWIVADDHALGFELDVAPYHRFRSARMNLKLMYALYF